MDYINIICVIFFILNVFCLGLIKGLLDSRDFWRRKWEEAINNEDLRSRR